MGLQHLGTHRMKSVSVITEWLYVVYIAEYLIKTGVLWNKNSCLIRPLTLRKLVDYETRIQRHVKDDAEIQNVPKIHHHQSRNGDWQPRYSAFTQENHEYRNKRAGLWRGNGTSRKFLFYPPSCLKLGWSLDYFFHKCMGFKISECPRHYSWKTHVSYQLLDASSPKTDC